MKAKLLILSAIVALSLTTPAFAKRHVVQTRNGQAVVTNSGNHRNHWRSDHWRSGSSVLWNVGIGASRPPAFYCAEVTTISLSCSWIEPTLLNNLCSRSIAATASLNRKPAYGITLGSIGIRPIAPLFGEAVTFPPAIWTA